MGELWQQRKERRVRVAAFGRLESAIGHLADPAVFALSSACIMFAWIYTPEKLPASAPPPPFLQSTQQLTLVQSIQ